MKNKISYLKDQMIAETQNKIKVIIQNSIVDVCKWYNICKSLGQIKTVDSTKEINVVIKTKFNHESGDAEIEKL